MSASIVRRIAGVVGFVLAAVAYLCFWPVPADPASWPAPTPPGYVGALRCRTHAWPGCGTIDIGNEFGPEHIAIGPDGKLYAAMTSGSLLRMDPDGGGRRSSPTPAGESSASTSTPSGRMIAADAMKGLLAVAPDARVTPAGRSRERQRSDPLCQLHRRGAGRHRSTSPTRPTRFAPADWGGTYEASVLDILEQAATGRVLAYDPATASTRVVAHGFSFANGIALSSDGQSAVRVRDRPLPDLEDRQPRARPRRAQRLAAGAGAARQPARLSRQPDARPRRPDLGRAVPAAQPGGGCAGAAAVRSQGPAPAAAFAPAGGRSLRACLRLRRERSRHRRLAGSQRRLSRDDRRDRDGGSPLHPQPARRRPTAQPDDGTSRRRRRGSAVHHQAKLWERAQ